MPTEIRLDNETVTYLAHAARTSRWTDGEHPLSSRVEWRRDGQHHRLLACHKSRLTLAEWRAGTDWPDEPLCVMPTTTLQHVKPGCVHAIEIEPEGETVAYRVPEVPYYGTGKPVWTVPADYVLIVDATGRKPRRYPFNAGEPFPQDYRRRIVDFRADTERQKAWVGELPDDLAPLAELAQVAETLDVFQMHLDFEGKLWRASVTSQGVRAHVELESASGEGEAHIAMSAEFIGDIAEICRPDVADTTRVVIPNTVAAPIVIELTGFQMRLVHIAMQCLRV